MLTKVTATAVKNCGCKANMEGKFQVVGSFTVHSSASDPSCSNDG